MVLLWSSPAIRSLAIVFPTELGLMPASSARSRYATLRHLLQVLPANPGPGAGGSAVPSARTHQVRAPTQPAYLAYALCASLGHDLTVCAPGLSVSSGPGAAATGPCTESAPAWWLPAAGDVGSP